jgi:RimJ/RimL family protein N-acetyltransferase
MSTRRLLLEPLRVGHAEEMAEVLADPALYAFTGGEPPGVEELRRRYRRQVAGSPDPAVTWCNWVLRLRESGHAAGYVQATVVRDAPGGPEAEVAWVVGTGWQGRGLAAEAARALVGRLREEDAGVRTVVAHVHHGHGASAAVAAAAGLTPTDRIEDGEVRWESRLSSGPAPAATTRS